MGNPFSNLISIIREEAEFNNEPSFYFARVISELPNLKVMFSDLELDKSNLLIDKILLNSNDLKVGDKVIMIRNDNKFIIISKVVSI